MNKILIILMLISVNLFSQDLITKKITTLPDVSSVGDNTLFISTNTTGTDKLYKTTGTKLKTYIGISATIHDSLNDFRTEVSSEIHDSVTNFYRLDNTGTVTTTSGNYVHKINSTGSMKIGNSAMTDYSQYEKDGTYVMAGQATVWKDLQFNAYRAGGANIPTSTAFIGNIEAYTFAVNDYFFTGPQEIPHDWQEGDTLYFHIHWANQDSITGSIKYVKWEIEWAIQNVNGTYYSTTVTSSEIPVAQNTRPKTHFISDIVSVYPSTSISKNPNVNLSAGKIGIMIICRIRRIAASGTAVASNPYFMQMGIHYKANTIGSRVVYTK